MSANEAIVRENIPFWVVSSRKRRSTGKRLHIPADDSRDDPEPICPVSASPPPKWTDKDLSVFPPGYRKICPRCLTRWDDHR